MDPTAFLRSVERGQVPPVALVHGADAQLLDDLLAAVTHALFPDPAHAAFDREILDGRDVTADAVVNAALTLPFGAATRLVAVRHCQALAARGAEALGPYVVQPSPTTVLLLLADEPLRAVRDRKEHWLLGTVPAGLVVESVARRGRALEVWVRQRAQLDGLSVSEDAVRLLVQWVGDDPALLLGEVRKAALAGGPDNRSVGEAQVRAVVGEHRVSGVFDLTRAIERRDLGVALRTLDTLLATEEPMMVLALLTRALRASLGGDASTALGRKLRRCWEVERALKSGGEARAEMALLVSHLCDAR